MQRALEIRHVARLQIERDGRVVEGEWTVPGTARDRYREWLGLYGTVPTVVIQLIEVTDGRERVRRRWTVEGEVEDSR